MINHRMKKVKAFFYVLSQSIIPNKNYYKKIAKTNFSFSFKYLIGLMFFLNIMLILFLSSRYSYGKIKNFLNATVAGLESYPKDLIISVQNNTLFTTLNRPYFFWFNQNGQQRLFLVVDQSADTNKINIYKSSFLLTPTSIVMRIGDKNKIFPLTVLNALPSTVFNGTINKEVVNRWVLDLNNIKRSLPFYYFVVVAFLFILFFAGSLITTLIYLFAVSLIAYFYFKTFQHRHFHFKKVFQISFHANTFPYLLHYLLLSFPQTIKLPYPTVFSFQFFPFVFLLILVLFTNVGVWEAYHKE